LQNSIADRNICQRGRGRPGRQLLKRVKRARFTDYIHVDNLYYPHLIILEKVWSPLAMNAKQASKHEEREDGHEEKQPVSFSCLRPSFLETYLKM
jgi:hypothetical protein